MTEYETTFLLEPVSFYSDTETVEEAVEDARIQFLAWMWHVQHEITGTYKIRILEPD
jgi:hypothetical protein